MATAHRFVQHVIDMDVQFVWGDTVFLKTDPDQLPRMIVGVVVKKSHVMYEVVKGETTSYHYDYEMAREKDVIQSTSN